MQSTLKKIDDNKYEVEVVLGDKVYLPTYYKHQPWIMNEILAKIKAHELQIARWMLTKDPQLMKLNLGTNAKPQLVKINA